MQALNAQKIKVRLQELGADLCGIASIGRFADAPTGFHPTDIMQDCKSVIAVAVEFPASTVRAGTKAGYTFVRMRLADKMDAITFQISVELEKRGYNAIAVPSSEPYEYWDESRRHGQGILSLKHAAVRAGLGQMGKNTLLLNNTYGNMLWLGAILVDVELEADDLAAYQACIPNCRICLETCPAKALDGTTIVQQKCRSIAGGYSEGGGWLYTCNECRKVCPHREGIL